ncbi:MAG: BamA/TamA family outer membrane protein [Culturomica sp.]|jgi:outer membrane protein assembly factor BamA|nr:BamA/TamA family outer membrane protein [Culturomica sp.]
MSKYTYIVFLFLLTACSTTRKLGEGEVLYTGVKKIRVETPEKFKLEGKQGAALKRSLSVPPNNPLFAPYVRSPFPVGLWVYNWNVPEKKGLKSWLYKKLSKKPVLISTVQPDLRVRMVENTMKDYGFFGTQASYEVIPNKRNPKKAKISYRVVLPPPLCYDTIALAAWPVGLDTLLLQSMRATAMSPGDQYDVNIMEQERERIAAVFRNRGYYYFQPVHIEFLVDTNRLKGKADVRIALKQGVPEAALHPYRIKEIEVLLAGESRRSRPDTLTYDSLKIVYTLPQRLKPQVIARAVRERPGQLYTAWRQSRTQSDVVRLGVFRYVYLGIDRTDTLSGRWLNYRISADYALPIDSEVEFGITSKSNNLLGPALALTLSNKNMFRRAQTFSLKLTGAYEWQVGGQRTAVGRSGLINSYELGLSLGLSVPRLVVPKFMQANRDRQEKTQFQIGADLLNRHSYFRMISLWGSATYDFNSSRRHYHTIVPFKLNYTHLLRTSSEFDSTLLNNRIIERSFRDQFIPSASYTYTYDRRTTYRRPHRFFWQATLTEAGNLVSGAMSLFGYRGEGRKLLGNRYSQFLKLNTEMIHYRQLDENSYLALHFAGGIGYAYGNARVMPYSEQFYSGGSNSLRAFQIRSIGPGSYYPENRAAFSYLDRTGDIKIEGNLEYRFHVTGGMNAAFFLDAGNIWLLRPDSARPGGELTFKKLWDKFALGTGFGLRYDITYLVVRADLGIALHVPYPTGQSGYFNIPRYGFRDGLVLNLAIGYPF